MAWAAGNDSEVTAKELAAAGCMAEVARFLERVFFSTGIADVTGSSGGSVVCSFAGAGF